MDDEVLSVLPIHFSNNLDGLVQIHQYPLLSRPIQTPPSAAATGRRITARIKSQTRRIEVHVPTDTRSDVWNTERGRVFGAARNEDDKERNQHGGGDDQHPNVNEVRLRSEQIIQRGTHMLGVIRDGRLHIHPVNETHQFRPSMTYLDLLSRRNRGARSLDDDSDSDSGPPPDPDEPSPLPAPKKEKKKTTGESKEVQVSTRKTDDKGMLNMQSGISAARREILQAIRAEEDEGWLTLEFQSEDGTVDSLLSQNDSPLQCRSNSTTFLTNIPGL